MKTKTVSAVCDIRKKTVHILKEVLYEQGREGKLGERIISCLDDEEECGALDCHYSRHRKTRGIGDIGKEPFK